MTEATAITAVERTELTETERPIPFEAAFSVWLASLIDQSNRTKEIYSRSVADFIEWLKARGLEGVNQIVIADLMAYRAEWQAKLDAGEYERSALANRLVAVRRFLTHCAVEGFLRPGINKARIQTYLKSPKQEQGTKLPVYLEKDEIRRLRRAATNKRDKALLVLALGAGLRVSELVNLKVGDLKPQKDGGAILEIRNGKGNKSRSFRIPKKVGIRSGPISENRVAVFVAGPTLKPVFLILSARTGSCRGVGSIKSWQSALSGIRLTNQ